MCLQKRWEKIGLVRGLEMVDRNLRKLLAGVRFPVQHREGSEEAKVEGELKLSENTQVFSVELWKFRDG